jgi:hypothetical protein
LQIADSRLQIAELPLFWKTESLELDQQLQSTMAMTATTVTEKFEALDKCLESTAAVSLAASDPKVTTALTSDCARDTIRTMLEQHFHIVPIVGGTIGRAHVINVLTLQDVVAGE